MHKLCFFALPVIAGLMTASANANPSCTYTAKIMDDNKNVLVDAPLNGQSQPPKTPITEYTLDIANTDFAVLVYADPKELPAAFITLHREDGSYYKASISAKLSPVGSNNNCLSYRDNKIGSALNYELCCK